VFLDNALDGWERQQRAKDLSPGTIGSRRSLVIGMVDFSTRYPWQWTIADADDFFAHARGIRNLAYATMRSVNS